MVEMVFGIQGMGSVLIASVTDRDYLGVIGGIFLYTLVLALFHLGVDIMCIAVAGLCQSDRALGVDGKLVRGVQR
jgi:ABC-type dipeptide/oligopeptide/nickel transport system permease component